MNQAQKLLSDILTNIDEKSLEDFLFIQCGFTDDEAIAWMAEAKAETEQGKMQVTVMYRNNWFGGDGWTYYPVTVEISDRCPVCGEKRGKPKPHSFCEDGDWTTVDKWDNPCGHIDSYKDVLIEAGYKERVATQH